MYRFYTAKQNAAALQKHPHTIKRWVREGRFPKPIRTGPTQRHRLLWLAEDVEAWAAARADERDGEVS